MEHFSVELKGTQIFKHSLRLKNTGQISALPGFNEGDWWVQDLSASIPVCLFKEIKGKAAIDLCAAPGGKTMQLSAAGAYVTAVDTLKCVSQSLRKATRTSLMRILLFLIYLQLKIVLMLLF